MDCNPIRYNDPEGSQVDVVLDLAFIAYDLFDIGKTIYEGKGTTKEQWATLGLDLVGALVPFGTGFGRMYKLERAAEKSLKVNKAILEVAKEMGIEAKHLTGPGTYKKVAVIGRDMEKRIKPFAEKLREKGVEVEVFQPSKEAIQEWMKLLDEYKGKIIPDNIVYETKIFKENVMWREKLQKE